MSKKFSPHPKPAPRHTKHHIQAWLDYRGKTHEQLASFLELSRPHVTKIANGSKPYNQSFLEGAAEYLETDPGSLLGRNPSEIDRLRDILHKASEEERQEVERYAEFIVLKKSA